MTWLVNHPECAAHDPGPGHPENPGRLLAVLEGLSDAFPGLESIVPVAASVAQIKLAHDPDFVDQLLAAIPTEGRHQVDADTLACPASGRAALLAAGSVIGAIDALFSGRTNNAFCAVRPPGHHSESGRAMGFCLFNQIAIGARHALNRPDCERVAIVDFDVHHGNGTQDIFYRDPRVLYASTHQMPLYPGTGAAAETGVGNIVNVPLRSGSGSAEFQRAYTDRVFPALREFAPDLLLISAGFDAHRLDPLAGLNLENEDFAWVTGGLAEIAAEHCRGRVVSTLEGGYHLQALVASAVAHVGALLQAPAPGPQMPG